MPSLNRWHLKYDMKKLKEGNCWKACFDQKHNKYLGRIVCTNREGQTRELYEITGEVFNRLGSFPDDYDNECLIRTGKLLFRFEDTMYGTLGPVNTVYDDNYTESDWYEAYKSLTQK